MKESIVPESATHVPALTVTQVPAPFTACGWRRLTERIQDAPTGPFSDEVEGAFRTALSNVMDVQEAVRFLRRSKGWDILHLYPAVVAVVGIPEKEAIRLVVSNV